MPDQVSTSSNSNVKMLWDVQIDLKVRLNRPVITIKVQGNSILWMSQHLRITMLL